MGASVHRFADSRRASDQASKSRHIRVEAMMLTNTNLHSLPDPGSNRQAQWVPGEDVPSEVLLDSTLRSSKADEFAPVDRRRLRNLVHERVFGEAPDTLKIDRYVILERL